MKKLNVFGAIIGFAVISFIGGYVAARTAEVSLAAQTAALGDAVSESFLNLWDKLGTAIFPSRLEWSVGIGTKTPSEKLSVAGTIESMSGGFKFPDGTIQQTAQLVGPQGPQGPQGDPGAQGPPGPAGQQLHLYDANGQDLGILVNSFVPDMDTQLHSVYSSSLDSLFYITEVGSLPTSSGIPPYTIFISGNGNPGNGNGNGNEDVYFTGQNCTGAPLRLNALNQYRLVRNNSRYFRFNGVINSQNYSSFLSQIGTCTNNTNIAPQAYNLEEITLPFIEPLAWPLQIVNI